MKRVSIAELVRETGLSRATIDRALNGRSGVHARTREVIDAAVLRLRSGAAGPAEPVTTQADLVLRVGRGLLEQLKAAVHRVSYGSVLLHDMFQRTEDEVLGLVRELCQDPARALILTAKNSDPLRSELVQARRRGKRIITLVSDLAHDCRDAYVGIDNRMAGQAAAFLIGSLLGHREVKAGVVLGDYAFSCHEDREIGFRSNLRARFPSVRVADVAKGEDFPARTFEAVRELLRAHPDLDAIYNVAGGNAGLTQAVMDSGRAGAIRIVAHEANHVTVPLLRADMLDFVLAQSPDDLLAKALQLAGRATSPGLNELHFVDVGIYTKFNLPGFALAGMDA